MLFWLVKSFLFISILSAGGDTDFYSRVPVFTVNGNSGHHGPAACHGPHYRSWKYPPTSHLPGVLLPEWMNTALPRFVPLNLPSSVPSSVSSTICHLFFLVNGRLCILALFCLICQALSPPVTCHQLFLVKWSLIHFSSAVPSVRPFGFFPLLVPSELPCTIPSHEGSM